MEKRCRHRILCDCISPKHICKGLDSVTGGRNCTWHFTGHWHWQFFAWLTFWPFDLAARTRPLHNSRGLYTGYVSIARLLWPQNLAIQPATDDLTHPPTGPICKTSYTQSLSLATDARNTLAKSITLHQAV